VGKLTCPTKCQNLSGMKGWIVLIKKIPLRRAVFTGFLITFTGAGLWLYRAEHALLRQGPIGSVEQSLSRAASMYNLDVALLQAVAYQESRMNPDARGRAGEIGMFQIMPGTAEHWAEVTGNPVPTERQLFQVRTNAEIAAWYLRRGIDRFDHRADPLPFALAYYNAGPTRAITWEKNLPRDVAFHEYIPFPTTRKYVLDITRRFREE